MANEDLDIPFSSEEEEIREVYAHYGLAMYLAQNLERGLAMVLALMSHSDRRTAWDWEAQLAQHYESTMGTLVGRFTAQYLAQEPVLTASLSVANDHRNELAHHYFWDRGLQFCSAQGRMDMLSELKQIQRNFRQLDDALICLAEEMLEQQGQDVQAFRARTEVSLHALLSGATEPRNPEVVPNPVELVQAQEWRSGGKPHSNLVFLTKDSRVLAPGEWGLCYGPQSPPTDTVVQKVSLESALPAIVNPRPKTSTPWNYGIPLSNGYILRTKVQDHNQPNNFSVWIQKPAGKGTIRRGGI